ncbi:hypothetical protein C4544_01250 [candidate division WS5 bacterium]|uniref:Uncharacterized protein n=1 Tax=candidate division WS5 bacterium TaxID=2093353 RepID=A0A419DG05_9BACT|nr:MAG: hypothetical protein C4544_01250 [candidate division WS5 bacterium]
MEQNETEERNKKDPSMLRHWKAWGSWHSWGSPVGLGLGWFLFTVGVGLMLFLMGQADSNLLQQ